MWDSSRSVQLSRGAVILFALLLVLAVALAPQIVAWFVQFPRTYLAVKSGHFLLSIYSGALPAGWLLFSLYRLLGNLSAEEIFVAGNVALLRQISWSCFGGAAICLLSTSYYLPWLLVAVPAAFMGLIVRIVRNIVDRAVELKTEADFTV